MWLPCARAWEESRGKTWQLRRHCPLEQSFLLGLCFNVRKLNQTLEQQEAGCTRCLSWSCALGQSFAHCSSGGLGLGTNLDHLSSDQNGLSNISQALNKFLVTRPVWKNLWRELKTFPSPLPPPNLSGRDEELAQSVKGSLHKQGDLSSDPQYT